MLPEATVGDAKLAVEVVALTAPAMTWTVGWSAESDAAQRRGEGAGRARRGSGEDSRVGPRGRWSRRRRRTCRRWCRPRGSKLKAAGARPLTALPVVSLTTMVSTIGRARATVGLAKLTVELVGLIVWPP